MFIRKDYVSGLQSGTYYGYKDYSTTNMNGVSFFIMIDILHELIHYGRYWNNLPNKMDNGSEAGETFENWVFGQTMNVQLAIQKTQEYGWNF